MLLLARRAGPAWRRQHAQPLSPGRQAACGAAGDRRRARSAATASPPGPPPPPPSSSFDLAAAQAAATARPPRFYTSQPLAHLGTGACLTLDAEESRHASRALRLREGAGVEVCDGGGCVAAAVVVSGGGGGGGGGARGGTPPLISISLTASPALIPWAGPAWVVAVGAGGGLSRGGRDDWLVEKCVELGAAGVWPLGTARAPWGEADKAKGGDGGGGAAAGAAPAGPTAVPPGIPARWERVARAAVKQSLRAHGLGWRAPARVDERVVLESVAAAPLALVAAAGAPPLAVVLADARRGGWTAEGDEDGTRPPSLLFVGPEGDFTGAEVAGLVAAGARLVGLGPHRLRVETAAVAGLAAVMLL